MVIDFRLQRGVVPLTSVNNATTERVNTYKFLGTEIDDQLTFSECATVKVKKLQQCKIFLRN